jgi:hypothetical protein
MSFRSIFLLMMLASLVPFGLGVMWQNRQWQQQPTAPERAAIEPQIAPETVRPVSSTARSSPAAPDGAHEDPRPLVAAQRYSVVGTANAPLPASSSSTQAKAALPVQIRFRHINNIVQATVVNVSNVELTVKVSDRQSGSYTTLDLAPGIPAIFDARHGLELRAADEVTLQCDSYRDVVTTVP